MGYGQVVYHSFHPRIPPHMSPHPPSEIDVEAIDVEVLSSSTLSSPLPHFDRETSDTQSSSAWHTWGGRVSSLNGKWWPLWILLGTVAVFFFITFGLLLGAIYYLLKTLSKALRRLFSPTHR